MELPNLNVRSKSRDIIVEYQTFEEGFDHGRQVGSTLSYFSRAWYWYL